MDNIRDALLRMYRAAKWALKYHMALQDAGAGDSPYWDIYGEIADAIYALIGEHELYFTHSLTYRVLHTADLDDAKAVDMLYSEYVKNFEIGPEQMPEPHTISAKEINEMVMKNGGYSYQTPEGDWK